MWSRMIYMALIAVAVTVAVVSGVTGFQDVLDTPALKSALAEKSLMNGLARAGMRLVGVGQRGHIVYSDDQGKSWLQADVPVSSDLVAVHFPSPKKGWAVGHDGVVLHSADGGATWVKQLDGRMAAQIMANRYIRQPSKYLPKDFAARERLVKGIKQIAEEGPDKPFLDVWFDDERTGFVVGTFNLIFRTVDGGKTWEPWYDRTENPKLLHFYAVRRVGGELFISGEQGITQKLDPQTGRFRALKTPYKGTFFGITGKPGQVIVFGLRGNAFRSLDGGGTWRKVETLVQVGITGAAVTEDGRIVLVSQEGHVLVSDDGARFRAVKVERPIPVSAVVSLDKTTLALAGLRGLHVRKID